MKRILTAVFLFRSSCSSRLYTRLCPYFSPRGKCRRQTCLSAASACLCCAAHATLWKSAGRHKVGPNLHGMFGSNAGSKDGFRYSDVVKGSGIVWSAENLEEWLVKPKDFLPGNKMAFAGVRKESDRKALITYLKKETLKDR